MTEKEACRILGLPRDAELNEIKKRYRQLITRVHPDSPGLPQDSYTYSAQEINIAYSVLKRKGESGKANTSQSRDSRRADTGRHPGWDAPVNESAYMEREILHYAEDYDGTVLGSFSIARGKYLWTTEEDFPLFLLSIYNCGKLLLDRAETDSSIKKPNGGRQSVQAELTYLLAQQFIDATALLAKLAKEEAAASDGSRTFYIPAMLEPLETVLLSPALLPAAGEPLLPSGIRQHRLYLKNQSGKELGYLSFLDDRLYYVVVPLLEQKRVRIKIRAAENQGKKGRKTTVRYQNNYQNLHLWLRLPDKAQSAMPENLSLQIDRLLNRYKGLE